MKAQIVFWLLAAIDGHAKNFSVFLTPGGFNLTPLYDVMSTAPYPEFSSQKVKLAMAVGDSRHYRLKQILPRHFYQTGRKAGLRKDDMDEIFSNVLARIDSAISAVRTLAAEADAPVATFKPILEGVKKRGRLIQ